MTPDFAGYSILVVDDDERFRERLVAGLERRDLEVYQAENAEQGITLAMEIEPELAVIDLRMPGQSGLHLLKELMTMDHPPKVVMLTGYGSIANALEAVRLGATHYLQKPANVDEILTAFLRDELDSDDELEVADVVPSLARTEWEHINRILTDCNGNIRQASRKLGIHRRTLQRKLAKFPAKE